MATIPDKAPLFGAPYPLLGKGKIAASIIIRKNAPVVSFGGYLYEAGQLSTTDAPNAVTQGIANDTYDNTGGSAGDLTVEFIRGVFEFISGSSADQIAQANQFATVYWMNATTVGLTTGTDTRTTAGKVEFIGDRGQIYVRVGL